MRFRIITLALLAVLMLVATHVTGETIYSWTDENGVRHLTNIPPVQSENKIDILDIKPSQIVGDPEINFTKPEVNSKKERITKVSIIENHVIVPVSLSYKLKKIKVNLLLDTGASNITLHKNIAKKMKVAETKKGSIRLAGGDLIDAEGVILDAVTVGPHTEQNLLAGIIEHNGPDVGYDGLLGMNFLKNYQYTIDFENQVIRWNQ